MPCRKRHAESQAYRYSFNGMEADSELKGNGNSYTTEFRQYDPRLGRWLSLDPLADKRAWMSPYNFVQNNPIMRIDVDGRLDTKFVDDEGNTIAETDDGSDQVYVIHKSNEDKFVSALRDNVSSKKDAVQKTNDVLGEKYGVKLEKYITETKYKAFENNSEFETGYNCGYNGGFLNCSASTISSVDRGGGTVQYGRIVGDDHADEGKMNIFDPKIKNNAPEYIIKDIKKEKVEQETTIHNGRKIVLGTRTTIVTERMLIKKQ